MVNEIHPIKIGQQVIEKPYKRIRVNGEVYSLDSKYDKWTDPRFKSRRESTRHYRTYATTSGWAVYLKEE